MHLPLIIPIENQIRELDAKLLLAYIAAQSGYSSYIGYRTEIDIRISELPRGIYLSKSLTARSDKMFSIIKNLGHMLCAWDEEALVHYPSEIYYTRRLSTKAINTVDLLFSWGPDNTELFKSYPGYPTSLPIVETGNPRLDLLRPELRAIYNHEVAQISREYSDFFLVNTNFGNVNAYLPVLNLFKSKDASGNYTDTGRGSVGMPREYAEGRAKTKQKIFESFLELIPNLAQEFPDKMLVIRPHPVENWRPYEALTKKYSNIVVRQEGNVIPWILAAQSVIHNGCTTGIESALLGCKAICYQHQPDDLRFVADHVLPNQLSQQVSSLEELIDCINSRSSVDNISTVKNVSPVLKKHIGEYSTTLCCEKIINTLIDYETSLANTAALTDKLKGFISANRRRLIKRVKCLNPNSKYHRNYQQHRFPDLNENSLQCKLDVFAQLLDKPVRPTIKQVIPLIFKVN